MSGALILRGARVLDPSQSLDAVRDVIVRDGEVAAITEQAPPDAEAAEIGARGLWLLPGLVDLHVHLREPGDEGKETIQTGCEAAVAGGFTTVVAMPNTRPVNDSALVTARILERARAANLCRVLPAGAVSKGQLGGELADLGELAEAGCVCFSDDGLPIQSAGLMRRALQYATQLGLAISVHEEDHSLSLKGSMNEGALATRMGVPPVPASAEVVMVARDLVLAEETQGRLHVAHVSCERSVALIRDAKARGVRVTAEATPHHFTLTEAAVAGYQTHAKMNPPLRTAEDVRAIRAGLADGTLDAIATDHAPHGPLDKGGEFDRAAPGVVGLETALGLALELVREGHLTLARAVALLTCGPARALGLKAGSLQVGSAADMVLVDPQARWTVDAARFKSKGRNTPFQGRALIGRVKRTFVGGQTVFEREGE